MDRTFHEMIQAVDLLMRFLLGITLGIACAYEMASKNGSFQKGLIFLALMMILLGQRL